MLLTVVSHTRLAVSVQMQEGNGGHKLECTCLIPVWHCCWFVDKYSTAIRCDGLVRSLHGFVTKRQANIGWVSAE